MTTTASGIKYSCAKCSDMGWIGYEKDDYFFCRECEVCGKVKKAEESAILNFAEIPDKYKGSVYANFDLKLYGDDKEKAAKCLNMCRGYTQNYSQLENAKGLYMFGNVKGTGKTRLMCAVANDLMRKGVRVKFTTSGRMLDEIKKTYDNSGVSSWQIMNEFYTCEYLIIDDFGNAIHEYAHAITDFIYPRKDNYIDYPFTELPSLFFQLLFFLIYCCLIYLQIILLF